MNQKSQIPFSYKNHSFIFSALPPSHRPNRPEEKQALPALLFFSCFWRLLKAALAPRGSSCHPEAAQGVKAPSNDGPAEFLGIIQRPRGQAHQQPNAASRGQRQGQKLSPGTRPASRLCQESALAGIRRGSVRVPLVQAATFRPVRPAPRSALGSRGHGPFSPPAQTGRVSSR